VGASGERVELLGRQGRRPAARVDLEDLAPRRARGQRELELTCGEVGGASW
jgi:hypothetical protein